MVEVPIIGREEVGLRILGAPMLKVLEIDDDQQREIPLEDGVEVTYGAGDGPDHREPALLRGRQLVGGVQL